MTDTRHASPSEDLLYKRACGSLPGGISRNIIFREPHPHYVSGAAGCHVTGIDGVRRVDFANNVASLIHGHAHPAIVEAVCAQIRNGTAFTVGTEAEILLAEHLCGRVPSFDKIRFVNSGTEAVMGMIKTARAFTGRPKIAKAEGAYHGSYDFAEVSQSSGPATWGEVDAPRSTANVHGTPQGVLDDVVVFPFNDIQRTLAILDRHAADIACVLIDPLPHRIGLIRADPAFIRALRGWTERNGALLAFDEVICFRNRHDGAQGDYDVKPDLTSLGKIIGGGFPVGAFAGRDDVMGVLDPRTAQFRFPLSGTFSANPVSMTAGRVALEWFDQPAVERLNALADVAMDQVADAARTAGVDACVTGRGSLFKVHFRPQAPVTYREAFEDGRMRRIMSMFVDHVYEKGAIIVNSCSCVLSTAMTRQEIDLLSDAMLSGFRHIKPHLGS